MRTSCIKFLTILVFGITIVTASPLLAQPGDCNFDAVVNTSDMIYLVQYLYSGGPVPDLIDCDCDGYPGVNYGDLHQLTDALFGTAALFPIPGTDVSSVCATYFMAIGNPDGVAQTSAIIVTKSQVSFDGMAIVYSFAPGPGEADLACTSVDFTGSVGSNLQSTIDNVNHTIVISTTPPGPALPVTPAWSLLATANFAQVVPGTPVTLTPTSTPTIFPMLLTQTDYVGVDGIRVRTPSFMPIILIGDVNADGQVDIDDVVYLITWIFAGGPPPGDPDGDGIPNW